MITKSERDKIKIKMIKENITQKDLMVIMGVKFDKASFCRVLNGKTANTKIELKLREWIKGE